MRKSENKAIERLLKYLEYVKNKKAEGQNYVFSHELADFVGVTPAQVRQDLMDFNIEGTPQKGYPVDSFFNEICSHLKCEMKTRIILVGVGNLGKAILSYFVKRKPNLEIVAAFDTDRDKTDRIYAGTKIKNMDELSDFVKKEKIRVAIITTPADVAQKTADILIKCGVRGIVNFAPFAIKVPENVFVEQIDITLSIEKTAYFAERLSEGK
ncbi:MAG TPA: redox-sensing transcriptional repressor Rex [Elusimicrobiales bacterium]|nr:redox-sensing transcriptional repressor Rex [Elusimicrobiales bacterium]HPO96223.1 redox-sensing transcriptional repressor Rex [Elusimicrobiales bacterium]